MIKPKQPKQRSFLTTSFLAFVFISMMPASISCGGAKQANNKAEVNQFTSDLTPIFNVSARTKSFLAELESEISRSGTGIENTEFSEKFIDAYNIRKQNNDYAISGFIKTNENFDRNDLEQINVGLGEPSGSITTVHVPIKFLPEFLTAQGIEYFEISKKSTMK